MVESRYTDQTIVKCHTCGWTGKVADLRHSYISTLDDADPADFCPACNSQDLDDEEVPDDSNTA